MTTRALAPDTRVNSWKQDDDEAER
jgi:hypothetical protein